MAEIILQDEFEPYLASRGFVRKNKVFRLSAGDGLAMEVWLNPENRLTRVATVSVDVALALDDPGGSLYTFDRANNAQALERGHDWRESSYSPELPGWPRRTVDDFIRYTVHFIDSHRSPVDLCESLLSARIPPDGFAPRPLALTQWAWEIAQRAGQPHYAARALRSLSLLRMDEDDHSTAVNWLARVGIKGVQLLEPVRRPNGLLRRLGVKGRHEALGTFPGFADRGRTGEGIRSCVISGVLCPVRRTLGPSSTPTASCGRRTRSGSPTTAGASLPASMFTSSRSPTSARSTTADSVTTSRRSPGSVPTLTYRWMGEDIHQVEPRLTRDRASTRAFRGPRTVLRSTMVEGPQQVPALLKEPRGRSRAWLQP